MTICNLTPLSILLITAACGTVEVAGDGGGGNPAVAPIIASVTPESGPLQGGNDITLTGENFAEGFTVVMNGQEITEIAAPDENTITFQAPSATTAGQQTDIIVYGDNGFGRIEAAYTYNPPPSIDVIAPGFGSLAGGSPIEIRGSGFQNNTAGEPTVLIGGLAATDVVVVDDTTIAATSPAASANIVAMPQDVVVENANGSTTDAEAFLFVRAGLLIATRKDESGAEFGISFFDIPTKRFTKLASLDSGVGRMEFVPGSGLVMRLNRVGLIGNQGRSMWRRFDFSSGVIEDLGPISVGTSVQSIRPFAFAGTQLIGINSGRQFGSINLANMTFNGVGDTVGKPNRGCLAANGATSLFHMELATGSLSTFNVNTSTFTPGPALTGFPAGQWSCHGATNAAGTLFAVFIDRNEPNDPAALYRINTVNGAVTLEADIGNGYGAIAATPAGF